MSKSKQTFQKNEKEKKKKQKQKEKLEKRELRKVNSSKGKGAESMMAYVDHNGQLSSTPPDPRTKVEISVDEILLGPQTILREQTNVTRSGRIAIYNRDRTFGFIKDGQTHEKIFFHISEANYEVKEGDAVNFEMAHGPKGIVATNIVNAT